MNINLEMKDGDLYYISDKTSVKLFRDITSIFKFNDIQRFLERVFIDKMNEAEFLSLIDRKLECFLMIKLDNLCSSIRLTEAQSSTPYLYTKLTIAVRKIFIKKYLYKKIEEEVKNLPNYHKHNNLRNCTLHCLIENCKDREDNEYEESLVDII